MDRTPYVLDKAFANAAVCLGLTANGIDRLLSSSKNPCETKVRFMNVFRQLVGAVGNDSGAIKHWLETYNNYLGARPADLLDADTGLARIEEYFSMFAGKW